MVLACYKVKSMATDAIKTASTAEASKAAALALESSKTARGGASRVGTAASRKGTAAGKGAKGVKEVLDYYFTTRQRTPPHLFWNYYSDRMML